jgi:hypothetical protein
MVHNAALVCAFPVTYRLASRVLYLLCVSAKEKRRKGDKAKEDELIDSSRQTRVITK